jgi:AraC-like DNA-binding protein
LLVAAVNDLLAHAPYGTQIEALGDGPLEGVLVERSLPGLHLMWAHHSPIRVYRRQPILADGSDSVFITLSNIARSSEAFGREHPLAIREALAIGNAGSGGGTYPAYCKQLTVLVPRKALGPLLRDKTEHFLQRVPPNNSALQLLVGYLDVLKDVTVPAGLQQSVVAHVHDLLAVTLGATSDALEIAQSRGIRAARLHAVKQDIENGLTTKLSIDAIAASHRITPRYIQKLFEADGTTFTEFVRDRRLERARAMLVSPRCDNKQISEIALEVGFDDLSYFDRAFRRRFGLSPRDVRNCGPLGK